MKCPILLLLGMMERPKNSRFSFNLIAILTQFSHFQFLSDINGDDHYSSHIGVGGLLNADKINLITVIRDNLEISHRHNRELTRYLESPVVIAATQNEAHDDSTNVPSTSTASNINATANA